jgi:RNA polymerase sigma-70 factor (ECF subfamily)
VAEQADNPTGAEHPTTESVLTALADDLDEGFVGFVRAYHRVVHSVAQHVCGSVTDAEDLAAESFLYAYRALRDYERARILDLNPTSWLLAIMHNTWRNTLRTASRRPAQIPVAEPPERSTLGPTVEEQVERVETRRELADLVAQLPAGQRAAVVLRHVVGLSIGEIATVMDVPEGTVKSHASRGLRKLRDLYDGAWPTGSVSLAVPRPRPAPASRSELR